MPIHNLISNNLADLDNEEIQAKDSNLREQVGIFIVTRLTDILVHRV